MIHTSAHPYPHTCSFFNRESFPWQPSESLPQLLLLTRSLMFPNNNTLFQDLNCFYFTNFSPRFCLLMGKNGDCLLYHQLLFSQCLTTVLKTCLLNEEMRFSDLPFVCKSCKIHKYFEYLKTNLTRQKQFANSHMVVSSQDLLRMKIS